MFRNYFFLNRFVIEANNELAGFSISDIFTQEKDKLIISFKKGNDEKYVEISVNPGLPYINLRNNFHRAKKNTADFCGEDLPSELISFEISKNDRLLSIVSRNISIFFMLRGKFTNAAFKNNSGLKLFKKNDEQDIDVLLKETEESKFVSIFNIPEFNDNILWQDLRKEYPILGKEIVAEAQVRSNSNEGYTDITALRSVLIDIKDEQPALFIDEINNDVRLSVNTFHIFVSSVVKTYENLVKAFNAYFSTYFSMESAGDHRKIISRHLEKELERASGKLNKLKSRIDSGSKEEDYNKTANLLLINKYLLKKGMNKAEVPDIYNEGTNVTIKLDETLSPQGNIDRYFDKSKNERTSYKKSVELYTNIKKQYDRLRDIQIRFQSASTDDNLDLIMKELKIKTEEHKEAKDDLSAKFKQYVIYDKYKVFVGRDSQNNDLLTTKFAKQNDYWFHARSVPGSHVILRSDNTKEAVPKDVLKKTASLAAYHSKAKTSGMVPVSYTFKKYVVKKKGMEAGKVALLKEEVLIVKPEIPAGCVFQGGEE